MVQIQAFRGLRYDSMRVGALSDVVAPPYDVINPDLQNKLYDRHPANVVRLILNRREPDEPSDAIYDRAARFLREWKRDGTLLQDKNAAVYVYHQEFTHAGTTYHRQGFLARVRLEPFGQGSIYPHEKTHAQVKEDRLRLTKACKTNLSPIFGIYPDRDNKVQQLLESAVSDPTPVTATDDLGVVHKLWPVTHEPTISQAAGWMADQPMFVADGHHRYEIACTYRDFVAATRTLDANDPVNYVMMMCISMFDPGLIVLPTHRLFRGIFPINSADLAAKLGSAFDVEVHGRSIDDASSAWDEIEAGGNPSTLGLFTGQDSTWSLVRITSQGRAMMRDMMPDQSDDWRSLGVAILHELVIKTLLGYPELPSPRYVHSVSEVIDDLRRGDSAGRDATGQIGTQAPFELAALVQPASVDDVRRISLHSERMPAKSTYFYPKLLSGLVFNPLE